MAEEIEDLPKIHSRTSMGNNSPTRTGTQLVFGINNVISESAIGIIVSGSDNIIGDNAINVSVLNSSGCIVVGGLVNVTILNSSGVTVTENNVKVENNKFYSTSAGSDFLTTSGAITLTGNNPEMIFVGGTGSYAITLPDAQSDSGVVMSGKKFTFKLTTTASATVTAAGSQTIDFLATLVVSPPNYRSYTISSNGSNWFIISGY